MSLVAEVERMVLYRDMAGPMMAVFEERTLARLERESPALWGQIKAKAAGLGMSPIKVIFSSITPGQVVAPHTDGGPHYQRFHLPITAPVHWWDEEGGDQVFPVDEWSGPVPFWVKHSVSNPTDVTRITVIVDFS